MAIVRDVRLVSMAGPVLVAREVRIVPGETGRGMSVEISDRFQAAQEAITSAAGRLVHVRTPAGWHSGYQVGLSSRAPRRHLALPGGRR